MARRRRATAHQANVFIAIVKTPGDYADLSWTLSSFQQVDFSVEFEDACVSLLRVWGVVYRRG